MTGHSKTPEAAWAAAADMFRTLGRSWVLVNNDGTALALTSPEQAWLITTDTMSIINHATKENT